MFDIAGQRFGRLVAISVAPRTGKGCVRWRCECDCGTTMVADSAHLRTGHTRSCGCLIRETAAQVNLVHGYARKGAKTPEYISWMHMRRRCLCVTDKAYPDYGGRGITICERWLNGADGLSAFECFLAYMGPRPSPTHSLDRIDSDGNYEPGNVRWATDTVQSRNRRWSRRVSIGDFEGSLSEACQRFGQDYSRAWQRISKLGWPADRAVLEGLRGT